MTNLITQEQKGFWKRFKLSTSIFWRKEVLKYVIPWILILIVFILVISYTFGQLAKIRGLIVDSLTRAQEESFWQSILYYLLVAGFLVLLDVSKRFTEDRLILKLRRTVNIDLLTRYLSFNVSYRIHLFRSVDNPDQRIEEDTRTFCAQTISLFLIVVGATATLVVQGGILFAVDKRLPWIAIAYAVVGSTLTFLVGKKLIILNWLQLMKEANYRFKLIGIRENSEAINFYRENQKEQTRTRQYLREAVKNMLKIIAVNRNLGLVTGTYNQLIWIVPHLLLAGDVLLGNKTYGDIITASVAFEHFLGALSLVVSHFSNLSSYAAVVGRLGDFYEKIEHASRFSTRVKPAKAVVFKNVSIYVPTEQLEIVSNLSFNHQGGGLLIIGDSGVGKSSVLRVIAGLWDSFTGEVYAPEAKESFFVPQKPYCFEGTLLSQLLFGVKKLPSLSRVIKTAELCGLGPTIEKHGSLNVVQDWNKVLSLGEQQKIAWVRLFLADRKFCFIDEMTTAVDIHFEELFYKELSMRAYLWISVGVRESLFKYHQVKLYLDGGGKWRLVE